MTKSFNLIKEQQIPEINSLVQLWEHKRTGARLLSVINDDENKVFSINFRTTPKDSTGVAHILEHSVLNGSEKYPVKEPFVELLKGSLATLLTPSLSPIKLVTLLPAKTKKISTTLSTCTLTRSSIPSSANRLLCKKAGTTRSKIHPHR